VTERIDDDDEAARGSDLIQAASTWTLDLPDQPGADDPGHALAAGLLEVAPFVPDVTQQVYARIQELTWFRDQDPAFRSSVQLLLQRQVDVLIKQLGRGSEGEPELGFLDLSPLIPRYITLEEATQLLRISCRWLVELLPAAVSSQHRPALRHATEEFLREVAFDVAVMFARSTTRRGESDARLHDELIRALTENQPPPVIATRATGLFASGEPVRPVGLLPATPGAAEALLAMMRYRSRPPALAVVAAVHDGAVLALVPGDVEDLLPVLPPQMVRLTVVGDPASLGMLSTSMGEVLHGLRGVTIRLTNLDSWMAARAVGAAHAPYSPPEVAGHVIRVGDLVAERALSGDEVAKDALVRQCVTPLAEVNGRLLETVEAVLAADGALRVAARILLAHVNTVRYRLNRVVEITGRDPRQLGDALHFQLALAHYRLAGSRADPVGVGRGPAAGPQRASSGR
jgi:hypothetical protein